VTGRGGARQSGKLHLCATPIGNLEDVTLRVLETLKAVDLIAAEDTRHTRRLLSRYDIHVPLMSYREENREKAGRVILRRLEKGEEVALVSDAGTPGISDPGHHLVLMCLESGIDVEALPGPNAALTALVVSGLPTMRFAFEGFLPRKAGARRRALLDLAGDERTLVFYESPARVAETLSDVMAVMGDRDIALARELTKRFEEVLRGKVSEVLERIEAGPVKGELVLVVNGARAPGGMSMEEAVSRANSLREEGLSMKEAVAAVSEAGPGVSKSELYNAVLKSRE
jgi:16S rRNA (cytidine1402-2'-O)-methyltransferase